MKSSSLTGRQAAPRRSGPAPKRAQAERAYAELSATGAPVSAGHWLPLLGSAPATPRALVAEFQARPPAAIYQHRDPLSGALLAAELEVAG
jgi:hypothetical protein